MFHRFTLAAVLAAVGVAFVWGAWHYPFGSLRSMGPGLFPIAVGALLIINAVGIALVSDDSESLSGSPEGGGPTGTFDSIRVHVSILGSFLVFAVLVQPIGFAMAAMAMIVCCSFARRRIQIGETLLLAVGLTALAALVFIKMLGVQLRMFPL